MRILMAAVVGFLCAGFANATEPVSAQASASRSDKTLSRDDHQRLAQEHLRALGLNDEADRLSRDAQGASRTPLQRLAEARTALERILEEIRQLEEETGFPQGIELRVRCVEIATADLESLRLNGKSGGQSLVIDSAQAAELIKRLNDAQKSGKAKTLAETSLLTRNGRPATMMAGGRFPFVLPAEGGKVNVQYVELGNRVEALAQILESRRVRVDIAFENSERNAMGAAEAKGFVVPAVRNLKVNTQFEAGFGDTALWIVNVPGTENRDGADTPLLDGKVTPETTVASGADAFERPVPRTAILLIRPERVAVAAAVTGPAP